MSQTKPALVMLCIAVALTLLPYPGLAGDSQQILPMKERAELIDTILEDRIENLLPGLMRQSGIDLWVIIAREYNEDPIVKTFLPATWLAARRRTMLVIHDPGQGQPLETLAVARYNVGKQFKQSWDPAAQPDQWARLAEIIAERNPRHIGVNVSEGRGLADGVSATDYRLLTENLPREFRERLVSSEPLAVRWLETRSELELQHYPSIVAIAHEVIAQAFSTAVVTPGETHTDDVVWWLRDRVKALGLNSWFHPTVTLQRSAVEPTHSVAAPGINGVIQPGDLLHVDFGLTYLRLNTDTQQHAYVLRPGETSAPEFLEAALADANRLQDLLTSEFEVGKTGNQVLAKARANAIAEGIKPSIYSHPIGYHGHGAGTTIGMWDKQDGVPGTGDYPLHANTAYAIELNAEFYLDEWNSMVRIMLEEDALFDGSRVNYLAGRQTEFILIPGATNKGEVR